MYESENDRTSHEADRCCRLRQEHTEKTCEVKQAVIAEREDQLSDEGMKTLGAGGKKTPMSGIKWKTH